MSMMNPRRGQMATEEMMRKARIAHRKLKLNGGRVAGIGKVNEVEINDALTGESWRAQHPELPMLITANRSNAYVHIGCTVPDYFKLTFGRPLREFKVTCKLVCDLPAFVPCAACGKEF